MALETSAKTAYNVNDLFVAIGTFVYSNLKVFLIPFHYSRASIHLYHTLAARKLPKQQQPAPNAQPTIEPGVSVSIM